MMRGYGHFMSWLLLYAASGRWAAADALLRAHPELREPFLLLGGTELPK